MRFIAFLSAIAMAASAQSNSTVQTFGMVGIAPGQTARLSVLNVGGVGQAVACIATVIFVDEQGSLLKTNTFSVRPGRSVSLDLVADTDLGLVASNRRQFRAVVAQLPTGDPQQGGAVCALAPTLEIFEQSTGKTSIALVTTTPIPQTAAPVTQP